MSDVGGESPAFMKDSEIRAHIKDAFLNRNLEGKSDERLDDSSEKTQSFVSKVLCYILI